MRRWTLPLLWLVAQAALALDAPSPPPAISAPQAPAQDSTPGPPAAPEPPRCPGCRRPGNAPPAGGENPAPPADGIKDPTARARPMGRPGAAQGDEIKDPTREPRRFREAWRQMVPSNNARGNSRGDRPDVPDIRLLGKSLGPGRTPMAVLQVDKQTYIVPQGGQFSFVTRGKDFVTIRVESVGVGGVGLVVLPTGERMVLY